jgi:hypothetical protein
MILRLLGRWLLGVLAVETAKTLTPQPTFQRKGTFSVSSDDPEVEQQIRDRLTDLGLKEVIQTEENRWQEIPDTAHDWERDLDADFVNEEIEFPDEASALAYAIAQRDAYYGDPLLAEEEADSLRAEILDRHGDVREMAAHEIPRQTVTVAPAASHSYARPQAMAVSLKAPPNFGERQLREHEAEQAAITQLSATNFHEKRQQAVELWTQKAFTTKKDLAVHLGISETACRRYIREAGL